MEKRFFLLLVMVLVAAYGVQGAEKVRLATGVKIAASYNLPILAAQQQGAWKKEGLDVEWVSFRSGAEFHRGLSAGSIEIGFTTAFTALQAAARGVPVVIVSSVIPTDDFALWVLAGSRLTKPADLRGGRIGITRFRSATDAYARLVSRSLGMEKEVKIISTGGLAEAIAGLKVGAVDTMITTWDVMGILRFKGEVRQFVSIREHLPKDWENHILDASKSFVATRAEVGRRVIKGVLEAIKFLRENPSWAAEAAKAELRYPEGAAQILVREYLGLFTTDGRLNPRGLENVRKFLTDFGIISEREAPALKDFYTDQLTG